MSLSVNVKNKNCCVLKIRSTSNKNWIHALPVYRFVPSLNCWSCPTEGPHYCLIFWMVCKKVVNTFISGRPKVTCENWQQKEKLKHSWLMTATNREMCNVLVLIHHGDTHLTQSLKKCGLSAWTMTTSKKSLQSFPTMYVMPLSLQIGQ